ncbi:hypothetical protein CAEBREN_19485 [Caenorhabditis brenneri]|uniref:Uncharacterized protein n=1 Tax=Caenorhabditis brenneri TaxID=135651 RepID=G0NE85_CAEBE|nr:hypothetical protein CAEBREN_19485 [Caenorhabditis brenneri]
MDPRLRGYRLIQDPDVSIDRKQRQSRSVFFLCFLFSLTFLSFLFSLHYFKVNASTVQATTSKLELEVPTTPGPETSAPQYVGSTLDPDTESKLLSWELCTCTSKKSGKHHNFCYTDPQNANSIGKQFDCSSLKILEDLHLIDTPGPFVNLSQFPQESKKTVFVSAASDNHIQAAHRSIGGFYKHNPDGKYIFYSLDLPSNLMESLKNKFPQLEIRVFNTTGYPNYTNIWMEYRFKPLIIAEVMREFEYIWWLDSNIGVEKENLVGVFGEEVEGFVKMGNASPIYSFVYTAHGNFPVMFPDLLKYFPTNSIPLLKDEKHGAQLGANALFFSRTELGVQIVKWWVLCALDEKCMNPTGAQVYCSFKGNDRWTKFANCFRFDQSVLNLLLLNQYQDHNKYLSKHGEFFIRI